MKKAILLPYACDQHEPSRPLPHIFLIPDHVGTRDALLKKLFADHVCDEFQDDVTVRTGKADDYGDLIVSFNDDMFLFVTFIKE